MLRIPAIVVSCALLTEPLLAQGTAPGATDSDDAIDEITVFGAKTLIEMRHEITLAEDRVFSLFNDLNEDDGYDIICKKRPRIGSRIPKRVCLARMYREYIEDETVDYGGHFPVGKMPGAARHEKIFKEKLEKLAMENPQLLQALAERYSLIREYEAEREQRIEE